LLAVSELSRPKGPQPASGHHHRQNPRGDLTSDGGVARNELVEELLIEKETRRRKAQSMFINIRTPTRLSPY
jgi:hypothetical protein